MFSIITPTYKRKDSLLRAIKSLQEQDFSDWEMIIINDSPDDASYDTIQKAIEDPRIVYLINEENKGVNYSRNRGIDTASKPWIIFLDDDDYLAPDALTTLQTIISSGKNTPWIVTNRAYADGTPLTRFGSSDSYYSYAWDYLILRRCKGDATHCIDATYIKDIRFSEKIKQGEEWIFFYQLDLKTKMYYHYHNSTISDGYDAHTGLNFRKRTRTDQLLTLKTLIREGRSLQILHHITFSIYLFMRLIRLCIKQ